MPTWPATLPQKQFLGTTDQEQESVLRNNMDTGPPTRRNRFTATVRNVDVPIVLSNTQRATFDSFFVDDISRGALAFDWEDPVSDATVSFAFRSKPRFEMFGNRHWRATLELEIQP